MANGDVVSQISDQYLQQFHRSIGVSGMQKLQSFPQLQELGYNGHLSYIKKDFHGLQDFKQQMDKYSSVSSTLRIAWSLIKFLVPNNVSISGLLFNSPGLGSVGKAFQSIHGFGQVFSLSPNDLRSPSTVSSKASVYATQSTQASVVTKDTSASAIGGSSPTSSVNVNQLNGILIVGVPTPTNNTLVFDGTNLVWQPAAGTTSNTLAGDNDVSFASLLNGQFLSYNTSLGKWVNHTLASADIPNLDASTITTGILSVVRGGTGADLSATGGTSKVLKQVTIGGAVTVGQLSFTDISGAASVGQIPNLSASIITSGLLGLARGGTNADLSTTGGAHQVLKQSSLGAAIAVGQLAAADLSDGVTGSGKVVLQTSPSFLTNALIPDGSVSIPGLGFSGETNTGLWRRLTGRLAITLAGATAVEYDKAVTSLRVGSGWGFGFSSNVDPTVANADLNLTRVSAGVLAVGNTVAGDGSINATSIKQGTSTGSFSISDNLGVSHFSISSSSPYTNTFVNGNGAGVVFLGSTAKTSVADTTGNIVTAGSISLQTTAQTLPATVVNDTAGGLLMRNNSGKGIQISSGGNIFIEQIGGFFSFPGATSGNTSLVASSVAGANQLILPAATDTLVGKATTDIFTNKTYDTAGAGNVFRINGTQISAVTGTGAAVLVTSPTLVTPTLGVAAATSINKVAITTPATSATLTIANAKTLTVNNTLTFAGTDSVTHTFPATSPTSGVLAYGVPKFQQFTAGGTFTIPTGVTAVKITVVGAGGAGGGGSATVVGGGGGSGGVGIKWLSGLTPGNTLTVTVGTGGTGVSAAGGNVGTASSVASGTQTITTVTANGGGGGLFIGSSSAGGVAGAVGSGGDINSGGTGGSIGTGFGGTGAPGIFGGGGPSAGGGSTGNAANGPGAGGSGAGGGSNQAGGAGAAGIVIFEWVA